MATETSIARGGASQAAANDSGHCSVALVGKQFNQKSILHDQAAYPDHATYSRWHVSNLCPSTANQPEDSVSGQELQTPCRPRPPPTLRTALRVLRSRRHCLRSLPVRNAASASSSLSTARKSVVVAHKRGTPIRPSQFQCRPLATISASA